MSSVTFVLVLLGAFACVAAWETRRPRSAMVCSTVRRWKTHSFLLISGNVLSAALLPATSVLTATYAAGFGSGLLNRPGLPFAVRLLAAVVLLDLVRYIQHYLHHSWSWLWRFHKVHHSDADFDLTTGFRFHPLETLWTHGSYLAAVTLLAPPVEAVILVEIASLFQSVFAHANAAMNPRMDALLRRFWVTPEMHRVHHSVLPQEQMSNYGNILPWWDYLFQTYVPVTKQLAGFRFGLSDITPQVSQSARHCLSFPFQRELWPGEKAIRSEHRAVVDIAATKNGGLSQTAEPMP